MKKFNTVKKRKGVQQPVIRLSKIAIGCAISTALASGSAFANPTGATVPVGAADFQTIGNQLNVTNTPGTVIDWDSFSIGQDEITRFIQNSASSAVLNRVTGGSLSEILGRLESNGQVFLINPNGLIVGDGAVIDTAGFIGSTLNLSNESFASGNFQFNGGSGTIDNRGLIHVSGDIALIASSVENSGVLRSDNGDILLAAGHSVSLSFDQYAGLNFEVQAPDNEVLNLGNIISGGGNASLVGGQLTNSGDIELVASPDGRIFLEATDTAIVSGNLTAQTGDIHIEGRQVELRSAILSTGSDIAGSQGGDIRLLGDNIGVFSGSHVDATSSSGGGTILIGGEQQGQGDTRTSEFVYLDKDASITSNGGIDGDGGTIILFAENSARISGELTARGGTQSGDGGFIETSGLVGLEINTTPNAGANNGEAGEWLIDPYNITIAANNGNVDISGDNVFTATGNGATISYASIQDALVDSNVTIDTGSSGSQEGNIEFIGYGIFSESTNTLTLNAANNIILDDDLEISIADGSIVFNSDSDGSNAGNTILDSESSVYGQNITFNGGGTTVGYLAVVSGGDITFNDGSTTIANLAMLSGENISFNEGLSLQDIEGAFIEATDELSISGGLNLSNSILNLDVPTATIDEIDIADGDSTSSSIIAGAMHDNEYTVESLNITHTNTGLMNPIATSLNGGSYTLTGDSTFVVGEAIAPINEPQIAITAEVVNEGILTISGLGSIDIGFDLGSPVDGSLTNAEGATLNFEGTLAIGTNIALVNNGEMNVSVSDQAASDFIDIIGNLENNNLLNINENTELIVDSFASNEAELHLEEGGILTVFGGGGITFGDGSSVTGNGLIDATEITFDIGSTLAPGNSPGAIALAGNATFFDGAILDIELTGSNPGDFDIIDIFGDLTIGGTGSSPAATPGVVLNIINLDDYDPDPSVPHNIIVVGGNVFQPGAQTFNQSATGFDTLDVEFNGNSLEAIVSVTPPFTPEPEPPVAEPEPPVAEPEPPESEPTIDEPVTPVVVTPEPIVEPLAMNEPPSDIINDVLVINNETTDVDIYSGDQEEDELASLDTQCR